MPKPKKKPTHLKPTIPVNSKKRGKIETNKVYLTETPTNNEPPNIHQPSTSTFSSVEPTFPTMDFESKSQTIPPPNVYYDKRKKEVDAWQTLRPLAVDGLLQRNAPILAKCIIFQQMCESPIRCLECSTTYIACEQCALKDHEIRPLHSLDIWQVRCRVLYIIIPYSFKMSLFISIA